MCVCVCVCVCGGGGGGGAGSAHCAPVITCIYAQLYMKLNCYSNVFLGNDLCLLAEWKILPSLT